MKNFDEDRVALSEADRQFQIRGEVFTRRESIRPEVVADFEDLEPKSGAHHTLQVIDAMITGFIEDEGHQRYADLRQRAGDPVTLDDLIKVAQWLVAENAGRPTGSPSGSSAGSGGATTGTPSTDDSSSPVVED